jgi:hypothetical protein
LRKTLGKRQTNDPHQWAYGFQDRPRAFFGELIEGWNEYQWTAWRSFISTVFCQPFHSIGELKVFQKCTQLWDQPIKRPTSVWMPIGRRGGKSRMLAGIAVYLGTAHDWSPYLDPGELGVIPVLAADRRQARTIMEYVQAFLAHPKLRELVVRESAETIRLQGSIQIEVVTASYRAVRSRTVLAALCDEIAFWRNDDTSLNPDTEIIAALQPAMATIPNALLLGASSPYARRGVLWDNFERYYGREDGPLIWRAPSKIMNPTIEQSFLNLKYEEDAASAIAEYGAEFRSDVDAFVTKEAIDAVTSKRVFELPPEPSLRYFAFVDPSGGISDPMTLAIGHIDPQTKKGVLDVLRERRPPFNTDAVVAEFATMCRMYRIFQVTGDHYAADWPRERFRSKGVQYEVSKKNKSDIYMAFLPIVNSQRCELLDNNRLYHQLLSLDRRVSRGGHESIDHPPGGNDDLANVVAGVMTIMTGKRQTLDVHPNVLLMSERLIARRAVDLINPGYGGGPSGAAWR